MTNRKTKNELEIVSSFMKRGIKILDGALDELYKKYPYLKIGRAHV